MYKISQTKELNKATVLHLDGVTSMDEAEALRSLKLWIDTDTLPTLMEGEYYHYQLIGLQVRNANSDVVGVVEQVHSMAGADNLEIRRDDGRRHLIPLTEEIIAAIDIDGGQIQLHAYQGLLDDPF